MQNEISAVTAMMTQVTKITHVFDDCLAERGGGPVHYILELNKHLYLVWDDLDTKETVISPLELWDSDNLMDAMGDPVQVLSLSAWAA